MWRKIVAGLALFAALTDAADAGSGRVRAPQKLLLFGTAASTPAPALWTPLSLGSTLVAWWDAQSLSASPVSSWIDKKSGIAATQGTGAKQPTWSATARNGKPGVTFVAASVQGLQLSSVASFPAGANFSVINIAGFSSGAPAGVAFSYGQLGGNSLRAFGAKNSNVWATNGTTDFITTFPYDGNDVFAQWTYSSVADSITADGGAPQNGALASPATTLVTGFIGFYMDGSGSPFNGTIQQIVVTNTSPTTNQFLCLQGWESWYDGKAGANLPGGHPYKSTPPTVVSNCS